MFVKDETTTRPFLKWPGGKQWLVPHLVRALAERDHRRYIEPFFGSGALFFSLKPRLAIISDINGELVCCLRAVRSNPTEVLRQLALFKSSKEHYEWVRSWKPRTPAQQAARLIYLLRTSWGGLYRLNSKGAFNVPYGDSGRPFIVPEQVIAASRALRNASIRCSDFEDIVAEAKHGDLVYADPPYSVATTDKEFFGRYTSMPFGWADQERLGHSLHRAARKGVAVILSGMWSGELLELYPGWWAQRISRYSAVAAEPKNRRIVSETLIANFSMPRINGHRVVKIG